MKDSLLKTLGKLLLISFMSFCVSAGFDYLYSIYGSELLFGKFVAGTVCGILLSQIVDM